MTRPRTTNRPSPVSHDAREWTDEEVETMTSMLADAKSFSEIGEVLGRTRTSVAGKLNRMRHQALPADERREIRRKYEKPKPPREPRVQVKRPKPFVPTNSVAPRVAPTSNLFVSQNRARRHDTRRWSNKNLLPFLMTKGGTLLHVYDRHPHVLEPLATFEKRGDWWVKRGDPRVRKKKIADAVELLM